MSTGWLARVVVIVAGVSIGTGLLAACSMAAPVTNGLVTPVVTSETPPEGGVVPAPKLDEQTPSADREVAVLAGGCFWGVQGVFQHVEGVLGAVSGYAGGEGDTAHYDMVGTGTTGHAEAVEITFDPDEISFGEILHIYFSVAHDPTQLDRQGPDVGSQYRSAIFPANEEQRRVARAYIYQLDQAEVFDSAIATTIEPEREFYPAEDYHQDFMELNPTYPYIVANDAPKLEALQILFPDRYRAEPVLVGPADPTLAG